MIPQSSPSANYLTHKAGIDAAISRVLDSGWYILGQEVIQFEQEFASAMDAEWCVGLANGTDAIELALRATGIVAGDSVITVSHTAVATVSAILRIGARPLFVDINADSYTLDPASLESLLETPAGREAKALVVVHLYGCPADMPALLTLAKLHGLSVIEDCAQSHGAKLHGRMVGTWGDLGCYSFYPTKNLGALGDGGAVIGNNPSLKQRLRLLREYGWKTRYISDSVGFNSRLDEVQAAILREKLPYLFAENQRRCEIATQYDQLLLGSGLKLPYRIPSAEHVFHQYVIASPKRDKLREALNDDGISTLVHYPSAVHQQPGFSDPRSSPCPLPHTEAAAATVLSLPMFPELDDHQVQTVAKSILQHIGRV